jgi:hypothetical protein
MESILIEAAQVAASAELQLEVDDLLSVTSPIDLLEQASILRMWASLLENVAMEGVRYE